MLFDWSELGRYACDSVKANLQVTDPVPLESDESRIPIITSITD